MRSKKEIEAAAYDKACDEACTTDCSNYCKGTCPVRYFEKTKCYIFKQIYDYYIDEIITDDCTADHKIHSCIECDEYRECPYMYSND